MPDRWTRVISLEHDDLKKDLMHPLSTDLMVTPNLPKRVGRPSTKKWIPLFYPRTFVMEHEEINTENHKLTNR